MNITFEACSSLQDHLDSSPINEDQLLLHLILVWTNFFMFSSIERQSSLHLVLGCFLNQTSLHWVFIPSLSLSLSLFVWIVLSQQNEGTADGMDIVSLPSRRRRPETLKEWIQQFLEQLMPTSTSLSSSFRINGQSYKCSMIVNYGCRVVPD